MNMKWLKVAAGALAGCGIGYMISKRKMDDLEVQRDNLVCENTRLEQKCEMLSRSNDNYRRANQLFIELREKEAIVDDYDTWKKETEDILAEESEQLVDEMSDEEYRQTLAYIGDSELD